MLRRYKWKWQQCFSGSGPNGEDHPMWYEASAGGIGISTKAAKQLSSSGKAAKDKRKNNSAEKATG